ncbi:hypothetical protein [Chryseobacterium sp. A301]
MKKNQLKVWTLGALIASGLALQSCDNSNDPVIAPPTGIATNPSDFKGEVKSGETVTLDASQTYTITGAIHVKEGGKLVIPAGTQFNATAGTAAYLTVEQGGQIFANGTATQPIVFTSSAKTPGSWGGIVLSGRAPINKGTIATAEVGNTQYGGTNASDNSGSLTYVRIEYAGALFTAEKEFNGLSLFGVGNGTKIDNVSLINGSDDGIEFFGGTVNVSNIVSVYNEDDAFDWTEGWNGTATGIYTKRRADKIGNRGIEADNNSNNNDADPRSNPTIKNATFIGFAGVGESDGIKLRVGSHGTFDNIVLDGWSTGFNFEHDSTLSHFLGGSKITNVKYVNIGKEASAKTSLGISMDIPALTIGVNASATGAGAGSATPTWATGWSGL